MLDSAINKVVRRTIATSIEQLEQALRSLSHGVRYGVVRELDETGDAYRYDVAEHCAYYLKIRGPGIVIWRWSYVATEQEANRLCALITSLTGTLDATRANRIFEHATQRSVSNPRPVGMVVNALDFSGYPMLVRTESAGDSITVASPDT